MLQKTNITAIFLAVLGIGSYYITGRQSITALIPAFFGVALYITAKLYSNRKTQKAAILLAMVVALAGFAGSFSGLPATVQLLGGSTVVRPEAAVVKALMALTCILYFILNLPHLKAVFYSGTGR